jgi:hypothetical protein
MSIRYDFWSLIAALAEGLQHGGAPLKEQAKEIAESLSQQPPATRTKRENDLAVVVEYLVAIQKTPTPTANNTVEWRK